MLFFVLTYHLPAPKLHWKESELTGMWKIEPDITDHIAAEDSSQFPCPKATKTKLETSGKKEVLDPKGTSNSNGDIKTH